MGLAVWFSFIATAVAIFALFYAGRSAHAARDSATAAEEQAHAVEEQTQLQKNLARAAAEPMLWADIRADDATGQALVLLLGNTGPSIARNVKVTFDPPPPATLNISGSRNRCNT
jgi:hypothetical protein